MNKAELVEAVAKKTQASKAMADTMIDAFVDAVTVSLKKGESVTLNGTISSSATVPSISSAPVLTTRAQ